MISVVLNSGLTAEEVEKAERYFSETCDELLESIHHLSAAQWTFKSEPGRWSIAEIVEHVVLIDLLVHGIVERMSDAPRPDTEWDQARVDDVVFDQVAKRASRFAAPSQVEPTQKWTREEAIHHYLRGRGRTRELLAAPSLRGHVVRHPVFGPWDGYQWLLASAAHNRRHTGQIREVKADALFPD